MPNMTWLYLIEILHQTTTLDFAHEFFISCILSKFYIKPQPPAMAGDLFKGCILSKFYIKPQLWSEDPGMDLSCILSKFYIKPQL